MPLRIYELTTRDGLGCSALPLVDVFLSKFVIFSFSLVSLAITKVVYHVPPFILVYERYRVVIALADPRANYLRSSRNPADTLPARRGVAPLTLPPTSLCPIDCYRSSPSNERHGRNKSYFLVIISYFLSLGCLSPLQSSRIMCLPSPLCMSGVA